MKKNQPTPDKSSLPDYAKALRMLKNFIKTKPPIYDYLNSMRPVRGDVAVWLDRFSKVNSRKIKFIQVGANDGLRWDPLRRFILRGRWAGVLIEPILPVYELLKANYFYATQCKLHFENCVISTNLDCVDFWTYSDSFLQSLDIEDRLYYLRKSSLDKKAVEISLIDFSKPHDKMVCYKVPSLPLSAIIEKYFFDHIVDLIFIDAEGHDDEVIRSIDFARCLPRAILYESHNLGRRNDEIKVYLTSMGYTVTQLAGDAVAEIGV